MTSATIAIFHGEDDYRIQEAVGAAAGPVDESLGDLNRISLDAAKLTPNQLRDQVEAVPFLADQRIVRVDDLLTRFESEGRGKAKSDLANEFLAILTAAPPSARILLVDGKIDMNKNLLYKPLVKAGAKPAAFQPLGGSDLHRWIELRAKAIGGQFTPSAVRLLAQSVGANLWALRAEVDKLVLFADGRQVDDTDVQNLVHAVHEARAYTVADAIADGRGTAAMADLGTLLDGGDSPFQILALIQSRVRQLWLLSDCLEQGLPMRAARERAGLGYLNDWAFDKLAATARSHPAGHFARVQARLLALDQALKTGRAEPRLGLELFALNPAG